MNDVLRLQSLSGSEEGTAQLQPVSVAGSTLSLVCDWGCVWGSALRLAQEPGGGAA